jgi:uncharacterized protein (AIM24 family)
MDSFPKGIYLSDGSFFAAMNGHLEVTSVRTSEISKNGSRLSTLFAQGFAMQLVKPETDDDLGTTLFLESGGSIHIKEVEEGETFKVNKSSVFGFSVGADFNKESARTASGKRLPHLLFGEGFSNFVFKGKCSVLYSSRCNIGAEKKRSGTAVGGAVGGGIAGTAVAVKAVLLG